MNRYGNWPQWLTLGIPLVGAFAFGGVLGWVTAETIGRAKQLGIRHLAAIVSATLGAAVTSIFSDPMMFGCYCIGLAIGFVYHVTLHNFDEDGNLIRRHRK